jgi:cbb3-type cytochrome oxidase maturation protein
MSENIVILMIGVSTFLGAIGLLALIWAVRTGQFDDHSKFIDAVRHDNEEDLKDAAMMEEKKKAYKEKIKKEKREKEKNYRPAD